MATSDLYTVNLGQKGFTIEMSLSYDSTTNECMLTSKHVTVSRKVIKIDRLIIDLLSRFDLNKMLVVK